jgi:hypothetical protein
MLAPAANRRERCVEQADGFVDLDAVEPERQQQPSTAYLSLTMLFGQALQADTQVVAVRTHLLEEARNRS